MNFFRKLLALPRIPKGPYCYTHVGPLLNAQGQQIGIRTKLCPYWKGDIDHDCPNATCRLLNISNDVLLSDQCKICGLRDPFED